MGTNLRRYIDDHLAGAAFALDLLQALAVKHAGDAIASAIGRLREEIDADRDELKRAVVALGKTPSGMKQKIARLFERLGRPKLIKTRADRFSTFQALEVIALGILGKKALWDALSVSENPVVRKLDLERLRHRAEEQHAVAEKIRPDLAAITLSDGAAVGGG